MTFFSIRPHRLQPRLVWSKYSRHGFIADHSHHFVCGVLTRLFGQTTFARETGCCQDLVGCRLRVETITADAFDKRVPIPVVWWFHQGNMD